MRGLLSFLPLFFLFAVACEKSPPPPMGGPVIGPPSSSSSVQPIIEATKVERAPGRATDPKSRPDHECGTRLSDWCPSPVGDPCSEHKDVESCRSDPKCKGMPYKGESVIACKDDGTGFAKNCPTVGCISR